MVKAKIDTLLYKALKEVIAYIDNRTNYEKGKMSNRLNFANIFKFSEWRGYSSMSFWHGYRTMSRKILQTFLHFKDRVELRQILGFQYQLSDTIALMSFFMDYFPRSLEDIVGAMKKNVPGIKILEIVDFGMYAPQTWVENYGGEIVRIYVEKPEDNLLERFHERDNYLVLDWDLSIEEMHGSLEKKVNGVFDVVLIPEPIGNAPEYILPLFQKFFADDTLLLCHPEANVGRYKYGRYKYIRARMLPEYPGEIRESFLLPGILDKEYNSFR